MIDFNDFKNNKKNKIIMRDLMEIQKRLTTSISSLNDFKQYIPVMESISILHNSRTLIEININKYKRLLENSND